MARTGLGSDEVQKGWDQEKKTLMREARSARRLCSRYSRNCGAVISQKGWEGNLLSDPQMVAHRGEIPSEDKGEKETEGRVALNYVSSNNIRFSCLGW